MASSASCSSSRCCGLAPRLSRQQRSVILCLAGPQPSRSKIQRSVSQRPRLLNGLPTFDKVVISSSAASSLTPPLPALPPAPLEQELQGLSPLEAQKRLTGRVKAARTLQDFAAVINAGGRLVDAICLVAILSGLPRAVQRAALPVLTVSTSAFTSAASTYSASTSTSSSSTTSASSGSSNGAAPAPAGASAAAIASARSAASSQLQLSEQDGRELAALASGVVSLVRLRLREFDLNGLVTVTVGLAKLSAYVPVESSVFRTILAHVEPRLPGLGTKALANLMWALATAGVQPCGSWLSRYYSAVERQLDAFGSGDLANLLWGLAKFDLMPEVWLMDQLAAACLAQLQRSHCAADGATALTCLARYYCAYNYRLPDEALGAFLAAVQPGLRAAAPGDLVAIVHSAVCMSHMPGRPFMLDLYAVLKDRLPPGADPGLSYADFSRLLWSLSRVDCTPPRSWLREFVELAAPKLPHLRHRALSELIWALACWDAKPSPRFLDEFYRASARRLHDYPPAQIADTLSALSKLGCRAPAPWLGGMLAAFCASLLPGPAGSGAVREEVGGGARSHELVAVLEAAVDVCEDRVWLAQPQQRRLLQLLADTAASKFAVFDAVSHCRLVLALAKANLCPGAAWLSQQQASLASVWQSAGGAEIDTATAAGLRQAYQTWEVELDSSLAAELEGLM